MFQVRILLGKVFDLVMYPQSKSSADEARELLRQISITEFKNDVSLPVMESMILSHFATSTRFCLRENVVRFLFHYWMTNGYIVRSNALTFLEGLSYRSMDGGNSFYLMFEVLCNNDDLGWTAEYCTRVFDQLIEHPSFAYHSIVYDKFSDRIKVGPEILSKLMYNRVPYEFASRFVKLGADPFYVYERTTAIALAVTDKFHDYRKLIPYYMTDEEYPYHEKVRIYLKYFEAKTGKTYADFPLSRNLFERHQEGAIHAAMAHDSLSEFVKYSTGDTWFSLTPATEFIPVRVFDSLALNNLAVALSKDSIAGSSYVDWMPVDVLEEQFGELFKSIYCSAPTEAARLDGPARLDDRSHIRRRLF